MKHIISALVENKPGVLAHVAGMFAARSSPCFTSPQGWEDAVLLVEAA